MAIAQSRVGRSGPHQTETIMKPISQFGTSIKLTALIADLRRTVRSLDISIEYEKDRARSSQAPYPIAIRHLKARRDKLLLTISSLENHLNDH